MLNFYKKEILNQMYMPMPSNISYMWNFGFMLGMCLIMQILSGLFLAMHYCSDFMMAFESVVHISRSVNYGMVMRSVHANGASLFFIFIYFHVGRGLYFNSFNLIYTWLSGIVLLLLLFMVAFMGYVLPWGQMSFWGATVITNLLSVIPYMGEEVTMWLWGGFSVSNPTLMRFFVFHFLVPFLMLFVIILHIIFLHEKGSNNSLNINSNLDKISFFPYFFLKDLLSFFFFFFFFLMLIFLYPFLLSDPDNFVLANSLVTPPHIQPEWYFLFAYAILRCIPNKMGGVLGLLFSIMILSILPFLMKKLKNSMSFSPFKKLLFFFWIMNFCCLTFMGAMVVEQPFIIVTQFLALFYFFFFFIYMLILGVMGTLNFEFKGSARSF